ncbi:MAG: hypothetical protein K6B64_05140 [Acholeplasmatales bacterium]|nr:hypothetical protein [Acholeplasmatales bacterium]
MLEIYKLYLPKSKREVTIEVSGPRNKTGIKFDTIYFLDGQNAFKDSHASFGRSIRATKILGPFAKETKHRILGVAVYNAGSDLGRINEYSPFPIEGVDIDSWKDQDTEVFKNYCHDFIHTIIPFIDGKYNTYSDNDHRAIYGSSLGAICALYLAFAYKDSFQYVGAFSTPTFLFHDRFMRFLKRKLDNKKDVFLYCGLNEESDDYFDKSAYSNASLELYEFFKSNYIRTKLVLDSKGVHNEETWGNNFIYFVNFIYFDDIIYR